MNKADAGLLLDDTLRTIMKEQGFISRLAGLNSDKPNLEMAANSLESAIKKIASVAGDVGDLSIA